MAGVFGSFDAVHVLLLEKASTNERFLQGRREREKEREIATLS